jgi:hypothetical protein
MKEEETKINDVFDGYLKKPVKKAQFISEMKRFLPFTINDQIKSDAFRPKNNFVECRQLNALQKEIAEELENDILPRYNEIKDAFYIDDVIEFSKILKQAGEKGKIEILISYAEQLYDSAQLNDIDQIENFLLKFHEIIEKCLSGK